MRYRFAVVLTVATLLLLVVDAGSQESNDAPLSDRVGHHSCLVRELSDLAALDLKGLRSFHVTPEPESDSSAHNFVADSLLQLGFVVSIGTLDDMPEDVDVVVYSRSKYQLDLGFNYTHLIDLLIMFRTPNTNELIGVARLRPTNVDMPERVKIAVQDLLDLLKDPQRAAPC